MVESLFNKFKEDKVRMLSVEDHRGMLQVQREIHQVKQRLSSAIIIKAEDVYDSDCDDISSAKAVLMANLLSCDSDVLYEVSYSDISQNDMMNQGVQEL
ncbi:hypothetical protein Tco_0704769 [Tanacetum coccineum]|uniref:Uncharacterized protein n=1 Tax=Tanacetum coccineum TaxID=301880 RepID=A0ABQ4Y4N8_9ASTR